MFTSSEMHVLAFEIRCDVIIYFSCELECSYFPFANPLKFMNILFIVLFIKKNHSNCLRFLIFIYLYYLMIYVFD